jgi:hypothetical protein
MSEKRDKRGDLPLSVRNLLRGTKDPFGQISMLRQSLSSKHLPALLKWLHTFGTKARAFQAGKRPRALRHLRSEGRVLGPIGIDDEFDWAAESILQHDEFIGRFLKASREMERRLLACDTEECLKYLNQLESELCFSQWGINYRLLLLQNAKRLESQKAFLADIRTQLSRSVVEFVSYFVSQRNEEKTNPFSFRKLMLTNISQWKGTVDFQDYIEFKLLDTWSYTSEGTADVLSGSLTPQY